MSAVTLSLAMIVRDEEATLGRVLAQAARFCDELVVVDTGSTDGTIDVARRAGARVVEWAWRDDFAAARNVSFQECSSDWILWLDADDVLPDEVVEGLAELKGSLLLRPDVDAVWLSYRYHYDSDGRCTLSFQRERLVRRSAGHTWAGRVHEVMTVDPGRSAHTADVWVEHRPTPEKWFARGDRNLRILQAAYDEGDRSSRTLFYLGNELRDNDRHAEAVSVYSEYLDHDTAVWEKYAALVSMARCSRTLGDRDGALAQASAAIALDSSRAEAFMLSGELHFHEKEWARAAPYFAAAAMAVRPSTGFVNDADYGHRPSDFLSVCLANTGRHEASVEQALLSLRLGNPDRARLRKNLHWSIDQL